MGPVARRRAGIVLSLAVCSVVASVACTDTLTGTIAIVTGPDNGFTQSPVPTSLLVQFINTNGEAGLAVRTNLPTDGSLTLPPQPGANVETIQITGFDDAGDAVVSGTTIPVALDQLNGLTLNVFVQRTGQFSRLPSVDGGTAIVPLPSKNPLLTTLYSRYLLISNSTGKADAEAGTTSAAQLYDTLTWQSEPDPPPLPIPPLSVAYVDTWTGTDAASDANSIATLLLLGANGMASWLDLTDSTGADAEVTTDAAAPDGGQFSLVAGGQTIVVPPPPIGSGNTYIVGATRMTGPTTEILRVSPTGVLSWASLKYPRLGAAAAFTNGGLYVFGGSDDPTAGGVEFLPDNGSTTTIPSPGLPPDTTKGAGAVALDNNTILLAGGLTASGHAAPVRLWAISGDAGVTPDAADDSGDAGADADATIADATLAKDATKDTGATKDAGHTDGGDAGVGDAGHSGTADAKLEAGDGATSDAAVVVGLTEWASPPDATLVTAQVFALTDISGGSTERSAIVVGTTKSGESYSFMLTPSSATPVPFRATRTNAHAAILPNGALVVVGGDSGTLESYIR